MIYLSDISADTIAGITPREILARLKLQLHLVARKVKQLSEASHRN